MLITEFRIPLPLTLEEFRIGHLHTTIEISKNETGNEEGVEILKNEPFSNPVNAVSEKEFGGQYTYKLYHVKKRLPTFIQKYMQLSSVILHEEAWNEFPFCKTELKIPDHFDDGFIINIQTMCFEDKGSQENVHGLSNDALKKKHVVYIDIVNNSFVEDKTNDPTKFISKKSGRGPYTGNWIRTASPIMTCYKLVTIEFRWFGLQTRIERLMQTTLKHLFFLFYRMLLCSMDNWYGLSINEMRELENQGAIELHTKRFTEAINNIIIPQ